MRARTLFGLVVLGVLPLGCAHDDESQVMPPVVLGMVETAAPTYDDGQQQIFEVHMPVELPLRRPASGEAPAGNMEPYPRPPFHFVDDTRLTGRFILSNLQNEPLTVELLIDPWNEFVRYVPGVVENDEETTPNLSGIDRFFTLPPLGRIDGIITPDDFEELATDLATAMSLSRRPPADGTQFAGAALYNRAFNVQNRSGDSDPVLAQFVPPTVAGLVGFDLGLRTGRPAKVAIEIVIDVEAVKEERVIPIGTDTRRVGRPGTALSPPAPAAP